VELCLYTSALSQLWSWMATISELHIPGQLTPELELKNPDMFSSESCILISCITMALYNDVYLF